ncbi:MAG TPA: peroxidase family protein [Acidimicrobiales bacterium]|nr:peroxidase family protein [Acidimicrobiales bacterium]
MGSWQEGPRWVRVERYRPKALERLIVRPAAWLDRRFGWDKLPVPLAIFTLAGIRDRLRAMNLHDTGVPAEGGTPTAEQQAFRAADGRWNDLNHPSMGAALTPFGRNVPPAENQPETEPTLSTPDPRLISRALLTRDQFIPATTLNVLAAAWLQFEIHDWFRHASHLTDRYRLPAQDGDRGAPELVVDRTEPTDVAGKFLSEDTHWWDGSQIYGSSESQRKLLRDREHLRVDGGTIPAELTDHLDFRGAHAGFWAGWVTLHSLFALEHNAICEHLRREEKRAWSEEELFETARLVNVALMAKIHTTEWTPAVLAHPTTQTGMRMNWWGISRRLKRARGRVTKNEVLNGIPASPTDHHGAPYCLTEEFVAVYRMHPLIPDEYVFQPLDGRTPPRALRMGDLRAGQAIPRVREVGMPTMFHSFGVAHPGAITLHNFPRALQEFTPAEVNGGSSAAPPGRAPGQGDQTVDLAAVDIFRNRERGVPRYNRFRQAFHKPPVRSFDELTSNPAWAHEIREAYEGDLDAVDAMIGLYAEDLPTGFGFSDTAFRVFLLMASRRLKSDRFFTDHYDEEHYTRAGLRWIDDNSMKTLLLRHYPELGPSLGPVENAFTPWARVAR